MVACAASQPLGTNGVAGSVVSSSKSPASEQTALIYPKARRTNIVDNYHGTQVADPYRWLEDLDAPETRTWIDAQNDLTRSVLDTVVERTWIRQRLEALWNFERRGLPKKKGERYFFFRNDGLQNQDILYVANAPDTPGEVLLDPNTLSDDGTIALKSISFSQDGRLMAYGLSSAGSDWTEWRVLDTTTKKQLPDHIRWTKWSSVSWTANASGFFYARYPEPTAGDELEGVNENAKVYFHKLSTIQDDDELVYERQGEPKWNFYPSVTKDGRYLVVSTTMGTDHRNQVLVKDLQQKRAHLEALISEFKDEYTLIGNQGSRFWFKTTNQAPMGRVIAIDLDKPHPDHWIQVVPETQNTLNEASWIGGRLVLSYLKDAHSDVRVHELNGSLVRNVNLPGIGTAFGFGGEPNDSETYYTFVTFNEPGAVYRFDVSQGTSSLMWKPTVGFQSEAYEVKQVFYPSKDGTRIPMFLAHKKGLETTGDNPTYLYGYGGFNISLTPSFHVPHLVWMDMGGLIAIPNLRGGGEYGKAWHDAGRLDNKQNVFDDFIAASEWLIKNGYTNSNKLAIAGGSNGGLLVGACMTQRPELFGAALPAVGVMDMLRFHRFTIGWAWVDDYGSSDDPEQFKTLLAYSPLHNLRKETYPATLVTTGDHDDRVVPGHSYKFLAELQHVHRGTAPMLIRIETRAGHGAGKPTSKLIDEATDRFTFLIRALDMKLPKNFDPDAQ
ncbi:MAG: prolyl oligopeptidase family serine peptidase [Myxococcales bacterium]|nr:prolyl oligopeptidase family serine peptidase [Myxococcales bacterium]